MLLQMAQADAERGERIRSLRDEKLHLTQEAMAEKVGITLRGYQEWEAGGGIKWENAKKLAVIGDVTPEWIMSGDQDREIPDLFGKNGWQAQLDRIEEKLDQIIEQNRLIRLELARPSRRQSTPAGSRAQKKASGS